MNSHDWIGGISNIKFKGDKMTYKFGVDLRSYKGYHYRAMNNLMGLDGYFSTGNETTVVKSLKQPLRLHHLKIQEFVGLKLPTTTTVL